MAKEHNGRFGKFYSAWAYDENEDAMRDANMKVYEALSGAVAPELKNCAIADDDNGKDKLVYKCIAGGYAHSSYYVVEKPDWLTMSEAALLLDGGNLCFGFQTMGNVVTIYTD